MENKPLDQYTDQELGDLMLALSEKHRLTEKMFKEGQEEMLRRGASAKFGDRWYLPKGSISMEFKETLTGTIVKDYRDWETDRKSTRLNSSHEFVSRMPSSA